MEAWKDIKGHSHKYQISNYGNVKIKGNLTQRLNMGKMRDYYQKEKIMSPNDNGCGYLKVCIFTDTGEKSERYIHRLVAEAFLDNPNDLPQVNHKDGNKQNNHIHNLEWVSRSENIIHAIEKLNFKPNTVNLHPKSPVVQLDMKTGETIAEFDTITEATRTTNISHISCVCRGKRKSAGGFVWKYK